MDPNFQQFYRNFQNYAPEYILKMQLFGNINRTLLSADIRIALLEGSIEKFVNDFITQCLKVQIKLLVKSPSIKNFILTMIIISKMKTYRSLSK